MLKRRMNYLQGFKKLKNKYFALRHGQSRTREKEIILSSPKEGVLPKYGLTAIGKKQTKKTVLENKFLDRETVIYSSDFSRALETASIIRKLTNAKSVKIVKNLRERFFGNYEKTSAENYKKVWKDDAKDSNHAKNKVESAAHVQDRTTKLIALLEKKYTGKNIVLVSHGDTIQILQTGFRKLNPSKHMILKYPEVAEIKELKIKN